MGEYKQELRSLTKKMRQYNEEALYRLTNDHEQDGHYFYEEVKPYMDAFDQDVAEWSRVCEHWIKEAKPKYIHKKQIETATENLHQVVLQSFYESSRRVRVKEMISANRYILDSILELLQ
ncbi:DUF1798 family protein [Bacillus songklensis]|uniref:DUF1798 family protein n=1 Tax=Bacillus songklensis TaxID=1069116 RepID=A0ABV8B4X8_9BACI